MYRSLHAVGLLMLISVAPPAVAETLHRSQCNLWIADQIIDEVHDKVASLQQEHNRQRWCRLNQEIFESTNEAYNLVKPCSKEDVEPEPESKLHDRMVDIVGRMRAARMDLDSNCR
jgi:hypothetical protein